MSLTELKMVLTPSSPAGPRGVRNVLGVAVDAGGSSNSKVDMMIGIFLHCYLV